MRVNPIRSTKGARFKLYGMSGSTEKSDYSALHHMPNHMPWGVTLPDENGQDQEYWLGPIENTYSSPVLIEIMSLPGIILR